MLWALPELGFAQDKAECEPDFGKAHGPEGFTECKDWAQILFNFFSPIPMIDTQWVSWKKKFDVSILVV